RILRELVGEQYEQLLPRKRRKPALELLRIAAAREVGVVPPGMAEVGLVLEHAFQLAAHPLVFAPDRLLERERLTAEGNLVLVVREGAVDGIAQERHQPRVGQQPRNPLWRERMKEVARARLPDCRPPPSREVCAIPALAA